MVVFFYYAAKSLETLDQSVEVAFKKYTEADKRLCKKLQENRTEQQELLQRLNALKEHEQQLEEERQKRKESQEKADVVRYRDTMQFELCGNIKNIFNISHWLCDLISKNRKATHYIKKFIGNNKRW